MNVVFYQKEDGTSPVADFLDALDAKMYAKVSRTIRLLEERGAVLRPPESKKLSDGIAIMIYDISRGTREIADWFLFRKQMRELGISVVSCHQKLGDPLHPDDFLHAFITVGLAHHMVLSERWDFS